jgi:GDP-L-fucose synthase
MEKIFLAGHRGMVGSAILRKLSKLRSVEMLTAERNCLNLLNQSDVQKFLISEAPNTVIVAAAKVGGIQANNNLSGDFIYENLMIQCNLINGALNAGVKKLINFGSSCIYPKETLQPIAEEYLLSGKLEASNEAYAVAKIAGLKLCENFNKQHGTDYRTVMPTNLYGPNDNFHSDHSHVIPGLIRRFHEAATSNRETVIVWGTGSAKRDFLHVDDLAEATIKIINAKNEYFYQDMIGSNSHMNVGSNTEISISDLAHLIARVVGFNGQITFDKRNLDGTLMKLLDTTKITKLGWVPKINLADGIVSTYQWYKENIEHVRM